MNPPPGLGDEEIGPPPGIDIPVKKKFKKQSFQQTSLEALNLELKVTVQDQQFDQIPLSEDCLEPSMNNLIAFNSKLCDTSGSDSLAIWDSEMHLIKEYKGLLENMPYQIVAVHDKLYLIFGDCLLLVEPEANRKTILIEQAFQAFCVSDHTHPRIVGVVDGELSLWRASNLGKPNQIEPKFNTFPSKKDIELQRVLSQKFEDCDDLMMLQNGLVFAKQKKVGEVFVVDFENDSLEELQTTYGCAVTCWTPIIYDSVAFGSNGQIVVIKFNANKQSVVQIVLSSSKDDIHHGLCYTNNQLFSISKNAVVTSWNLATGTKSKTYEVKFCPGVYSLRAMNQDVIIAEHKDKKDLMLLSTNLEKRFFYKARMKEVLHCCSSPDEQFVALVQKSGLVYDEEIIFHIEIEIYPFDSTLEFQRRKEVENLEAKTVMFSNDNTIQYILKISKSVNPILVKWNFRTNEYTESEMLVEKYKICQLYQNRSAFSYDFHSAPQQQFKLFGPKRTDTQKLITGISVYDENVKLLLKVHFEQKFDADVFGMPSQNLLYVLNNKNQIEVWDVLTQQQVQKGIQNLYTLADCRPTIIKQMKFSPQYLFLNAQQEWIIRDLKLQQVCKTKGEIINKCQFIGQKCIVNQKQNLFVWDLSTNQCRQVPYKVYDFLILQNRVLLIGESTIKMILI